MKKCFVKKDYFLCLSIPIPKLHISGSRALPTDGNLSWQIISKRFKRLIDSYNWFHCPGPENPADLLIQINSSDNLLENSNRWNGPKFQSDSSIPKTESTVVLDQELYDYELCKNCGHDFSDDFNDVISLTITNDRSIFDCILSIFNDYMKLICISIFIFKYIFRVKILRRKE